MSDYLKFLPSKNPIESLKSWFNEALQKEANPHAFILSTLGLDGFPNARTLLIKEITDDSIIFYTNYDSLKAKEIANNPKAAATFFWNGLGKQIRLKGELQKTSLEKSHEYFYSRPYESQIASFISKQSAPIIDRQTLESEYFSALEKYKNDKVPAPNWGGYELKITEITFFIYGDHRLNDRFNFVKKGSEWLDNRLYP